MIVHGLVLGGLFSMVAIGSLRLDARIWIEDYPPDIQAAAGAGVQAPLSLQLLTALLLFGVILGGITISNWRVARELGWTPRFGAVFVHTLAISWVVNLIDVLIVDWLVFVTIRPAFIVLPGTEGLAGYGDYWFHLKASVLTWQAWLGSLVLAGLAGLILPRLWARRASAAAAGRVGTA